MKPFAVGECDFCPATDTDLFQIPPSKDGYCIKCYQAELAAIESSKTVNKVIETSFKQDKAIQLKADIFNAATMSFGELYTAIQHDENIPAEKKNEVLVNLVKDRIAGFTDVIFNLNEQKIAKENEREGWRKATVDFISKLRAEEREKYSKFNITYAPPAVTKKAIKGKTPPSVQSNKAPKVVIKMQDLKIAAIKYDVAMSTLKSMCELRNMDVDTAGKLLSSAFNPPAAE